MFKQIYETARDLILISREVQENKSDIKDVKQDLKDTRSEVSKLRDEFVKLTLLVQKLSFDIEHISEREKSEREKLVLQLNNEMLKFERRLPSGKDE